MTCRSGPRSSQEGFPSRESCSRSSTITWTWMWAQPALRLASMIFTMSYRTLVTSSLGNDIMKLQNLCPIALIRQFTELISICRSLLICNLKRKNKNFFWFQLQQRIFQFCWDRLYILASASQVIKFVVCVLVKYIVICLMLEHPHEDFVEKISCSRPNLMFTNVPTFQIMDRS